MKNSSSWDLLLVALLVAASDIIIDVNGLELKFNNSSSCLIEGDRFNYFNIYKVDTPSLMRFYNFELEYIDWKTLRHTSLCIFRQEKVICEIKYKGFMPWYLRAKAVPKPLSLPINTTASTKNSKESRIISKTIYSEKSYFSMLNTLNCVCKSLPIHPIISFERIANNNTDLMSVTWRHEYDNSNSMRAFRTQRRTREKITLIEKSSGTETDVTKQCDVPRNQCILHMRSSFNAVCITTIYQHCNDDFKSCKTFTKN